MSLTVGDFLAGLDEFAERIPLEELQRRLSDLAITVDDVREYTNFGPETYQRNLMHAGPAYQALILCWRSGHRSPIHDHRDSSCGVRVLEGVATETTFDRTPEGLVYATGSHELAAGSICGNQDDGIHQMSNLQPPGEDLITLHIYSPPLLRMGMYSLTDRHRTEFLDPVVGFVAGDGI